MGALFVVVRIVAKASRRTFEAEFLSLNFGLVAPCSGRSPTASLEVFTDGNENDSGGARICVRPGENNRKCSANITVYGLFGRKNGIFQADLERLSQRLSSRIPGQKAAILRPFRRPLHRRGCKERAPKNA